tara:strand:+ start:216 stop:485 length:270 start_codon:yes stop_codon:yes gene_type:complete
VAEVVLMVMVIMVVLVLMLVVVVQDNDLKVLSGILKDSFMGMVLTEISMSVVEEVVVPVVQVLNLKLVVVEVDLIHLLLEWVPSGLLQE